MTAMSSPDTVNLADMQKELYSKGVPPSSVALVSFIIRHQRNKSDDKAELIAAIKAQVRASRKSPAHLHA